MEPLLCSFPQKRAIQICEPTAMVDCDFLRLARLSALQAILAGRREEKGLTVSSLVQWRYDGWNICAQRHRKRPKSEKCNKYEVVKSRTVDFVWEARSWPGSCILRMVKSAIRDTEWRRAEYELRHSGWKRRCMVSTIKYKVAGISYH